MVEVGREFWRSSGPTPTLKQGKPRAGCLGTCPDSFAHHQGWRFHNLSGQLVPVLGHPHSKKCFSLFRQHLLCFSLCPLPLVLSLDTAEEAGYLFFTLSLQKQLYTLMRSCMSLAFQAEQFQLFQPFLTAEMLQPLNHLSGPSLDSF